MFGDTKSSLVARLVVLLGLVATTGSNTAAQTYLFNKAEFSAAVNPVSVAAGDFNHDGRIDLAVANQNCPNNNCGTASVSILIGKPDGTFEAAVDYPHVVISIDLAVITADFNGDGKLDLAVASGGGVTILLGNGDGTFQGPVNYTAGFISSDVATADFNADGKLDLAVVNRQGNTVSILLGNGDGTFRAHVDYATGNFPQSVTAGDFNGDGKVDLAVTNNNFGSNGSVSILLGNGDGTFQAHVDYPTAGGALSVITADFNRDGKLDLAVTEGGLATAFLSCWGKGMARFRLLF